MGLRINTNIPAEYAVYNLNQTNNKLSLALDRLSTGLRITKAADDEAGMTIADALRFQSSNLGQAINNGNNAVNLIQIADQALQTSINLVSTIATKATQAANATQDTASREAIQADISKLLEEINNIASTTSYRGVNLLNGTFTNKVIQIGAYQDQVISLSIKRANTDSLGWMAVTKTSGPESVNTTYVNQLEAVSVGALGSNGLALNSSTSMLTLAGGDLTIDGVNVADRAFGVDKYDQLDAKTMAAAINTVSSETGVKATATNVVTGNAAIKAGTISAGTFYINGVNIGQIDVSEKDATGTVVDMINKYSDETGVTASVNAQGELVLTAKDGRNIAIEANSNVQDLLGIKDTTTSVTGTKTAVNGVVSFVLNGVLINGINTAGTTVAASTVAAAINSKLSAAGIDTSKLYASVTAGGDLTIKDIGGQDLNINAQNEAASVLAFLGLGTDQFLLENDSYHGKIQLQSDKNMTIGGTNPAVGGLKTAKVGLNTNLSDVNVTTEQGAQLAITLANLALKDLDAIRSDLGSAQNQVTATVENISITQININQAESTIRDVNFAKESSTFSKLQILAQSGTYALAQANTIQQNVLRLLR